MFQDCSISPRGGYSIGDKIFLRYYDNSVFPVCIYKPYYKADDSNTHFKAICLDKAEYKKFMNIIAYLLNVVQIK